MIRILSIAILLLGAPQVHADIYKCVDEDGNTAYQQMPCPVESEASEKMESIETVESNDAPSSTSTVAASRDADDVEACKNPLRDAIDAIEAEMLSGYSPEQGEEFKTRLRGLTDQMRACE